MWNDAGELPVGGASGDWHGELECANPLVPVDGRAAGGDGAGEGGSARGKAGLRQARCRKAKDMLSIYFANITAWNHKAEQYLVEGGCEVKADVIGVAEHHLLPHRLGPVRRRVGRAGFATVAAPARLGPEGGTMAGVMLATSKRLWSIVPERPVVRAPGGAWTAVTVRVSGMDVTVVCAYFRPDNPDEDAAILEEVSAMLLSLGGAWVLIADWNRTPTDLIEDPWLELVGGVVVAPSSWTCSLGSRRTIDFAVTAAVLDGMVDIVVDEVSPWAPHRGLHVQVRGLASTMRVRRLMAPRPAPPTHSGPTRPWSEFWAAAVRDTPELEEQFWIRPGSADVALGRWYGCWSRAVVAQQLSRTNLEEDRPYQGRGLAPRFRWQSALPRRPPGKGKIGEGWCFWAALRCRLREWRWCSTSSSARPVVVDVAGGGGHARGGVSGEDAAGEGGHARSGALGEDVASEGGNTRGGALFQHDGEDAAGEGGHARSGARGEDLDGEGGHARAGAFVPHVGEDVAGEGGHARGGAVGRVVGVDAAGEGGWARSGAEWSSPSSSGSSVRVFLLKFLSGAAAKVEGQWLKDGKGTKKKGDIEKLDVTKFSEELRDECALHDPRRVAMLLHTARVQEAKAARNAQASSKAKWKEWLVNSLRGGGGAAHRWAAGHVDEEGVESYTGVAEQIEEVTADWERRWWKTDPTNTTRTPSMPTWMLEVRRQAALQPLSPITEQQVAGAVARAKVRAGMGFDQWVPAMWRGLDPEALRSLGGLLNAVEGALSWPSSQLCCLMRMLPKPSGGHRLIVLTGGLYRLWSQIRRPVLSEWCQQQALIAHWDSAVQGSSALRVALLRACRSEAFRLAGVSAVDVLWDIAKFYDSVVPEILVVKAAAVEYPMVPMYLGLLVHLAARFVCSRGVAGAPCFAHAGILAGCGQSPDWSKVYMFDIMQQAVERWAPVRFRTWIDDIHQSMVGSLRAIVGRLVPAAVWLTNRLKEVNCEVASKSFYMATNSAVAAEVGAQFELRGLPVGLAAAGRDLGLDVSMGGVRRLATRTSRMKAATGRLARAGVAAGSVGTMAAKISISGALPQLLWGRAGQGTSPTEIARIRGRVCKALGVHFGGGCTTCCFEVSGFLAADPFYKFPIETVKGFLEMVMQAPAADKHLIKNGVDQAIEVLEAHPAHTRWHYARGPLTGFAATLLDNGWRWLAQGRVVTPGGVVYDLEFEDPGLVGQFATLFVADLRRRLFAAEAGRRRHGHGGERGLCFHAARRSVRRWLRRREGAAGLRCAMVGGCWPSARLMECGLDRRVSCRWCGQHGEDELHLWWQCPRWTEGPDIPTEIPTTNSLRVQVEKEVKDSPVFWLRGLPPQVWYDDILDKYPVPEDTWESCSWGCMLGSEDRPFDLPPGALVAVDASGGAFTADPRLRRVTFGLVVVNAESQVLGGIGGQVPGVQTVNRGELFAATLAFERTTGMLELITDSSYVSRPFAEDMDDHSHHPAFHFDLWGRLGEVKVDRQFKMVKVKSHRTVQQVWQERADVRHWLGNEGADAVASWAAGVWALPPAVVKQVQALDLLATRVQDRMACIMSLLGEHLVANDAGEAVDVHGEAGADVHVMAAGMEVLGGHVSTDPVDDHEVLLGPDGGGAEYADDPDLEDEAVGREWFADTPSGEVHGEDAAGEGGHARSGALGEGAAGEGAFPSSASSLPALPREAPHGADLGGDPRPAVRAPAPPPPDPGEEYEALVRSRPARRLGAHRVVTSGHLQWCLACRSACRTGGLEQLPAVCSLEAVRATFAGDTARIQLPHDIVFVHGAAFCLKCGACSTRRLFKLAGPVCRPTAFGLKELRRFWEAACLRTSAGGRSPRRRGGEAEGLLPSPVPARPRRCRAKTTPTISST